MDIEDLPKFHYQKIKKDLAEVRKKLPIRLRSVWPTKYANCKNASVDLRVLSLAIDNTFESIVNLCGSESPKEEYGLAVSPLIRTILEAVFSLLFLFEDLPSRSVLFAKAGWRERKEHFERYKSRYASDPVWANWLALTEKGIEHHKDLCGVSDVEANNLRLIDYWPTPYQMLRGKHPMSADRVTYLKYLDDWFYRQISQEAHLTMPGLQRSAGSLFDKNARKYNAMKKIISDNAITTLVIYAAFLSELEIELDLGFRSQMEKIWIEVNKIFSEASDLCNVRYRKFFTI